MTTNRDQPSAPVDTRHASDPSGVAALRREVAMLDAATHPGVVRLVEFLDNGDTATLVTEHSGRETWNDLPPRTLVSLLEGLATLAGTLDDLHARGLVHGGLRPERIVVGPDGPLLTGFGQAHLLGETIADTLDDPGHAPGTTATVGIDIHGLGALLGALLDGVTSPGRSGPRRDLRRLVHRSTDPDPRRRPGLVEFRSIADRRPDSATSAATRRTEGGRARRPLDAHRSALTGRRLVGAALSLVLLVVGVTAFRGSDRAERPVLTSATPPTTAPIATTLPPYQPTSTTASTPTTTIPAGAPSTTIPTGAPSTTIVATVADPLVVSHEGRSYSVGSSGDTIAVGDWTCDGALDLALVDASGAAFVFPDWPEPGEATTGRPVDVDDVDPLVLRCDDTLEASS